MKKKRNIALEIKEGLLEAIEFAKGNETEGRVTYLYAGQEICPREIREKLLGLTREEFCQFFIAKISNQRNWETGRRQPDDITLAFYAMIKKNAKAVYKMLHGKPMPVLQ
jgi:DNA-binding transcriptional regulator YiaG